MTTALLVVLFGWLAFNILAPYSVLFRAKRISWGRLPAVLLTSVKDRKVRFYMMDLQQSYGYSVLAPPLNLIVFDRAFFAKASPAIIRFVVAHELAHFSLGHHWKRWLAVVLGLSAFPVTKRWFLRMEDEADAVAIKRTGFTRKMFQEIHTP